MRRVSLVPISFEALTWMLHYLDGKHRIEVLGFPNDAIVVGVCEDPLRHGVLFLKVYSSYFPATKPPHGIGVAELSVSLMDEYMPETAYPVGLKLRNPVELPE